MSCDTLLSLPVFVLKNLQFFPQVNLPDSEGERHTAATIRKNHCGVYPISESVKTALKNNFDFHSASDSAIEGLPEAKATLQA